MGSFSLPSFFMTSVSIPTGIMDGYHKFMKNVSPGFIFLSSQYCTVQYGHCCKTTHRNTVHCIVGYCAEIQSVVTSPVSRETIEESTITVNPPSLITSPPQSLRIKAFYCSFNPGLCFVTALTHSPQQPQHARTKSIQTCF